MPTYAVTGRPLVRNGRRLSVGSKLRLHEADGAVLERHGRVREVEAGSAEAEPAAEVTSKSKKSVSGSGKK